VYTRLLRNDLIASLKDDYVMLARSKGLKPQTIMWKHVFRPSSMTLVTSAALNMGGLIGGTVVVENIFAIPGIGSEIVYAIYSAQIFMLQSTVAAIAVFYVAINMGADLLGIKIDPRTRERRV
jgi:peptide/nickel transport system permease protein